MLNFFHTWGIFELVFYLLAFEFVYEGSKLDKTEQAGFMIAIGGIMALPLLFGYSTILHAQQFRPTPDGKDKTINLFMIYMIITCVPAAIIFQSTLIGYMVFMIIFTLLGFRMVFFGLGYSLGWENEQTMECSSLASLCIVIVYIILRVCEVKQEYLKPFSSSICILGGNILYLSLLIMSSDGYHTYVNKSNLYIKYNIIMVLFITAGIGLGLTYSLTGLANTAIVYTILWGIEKFHEVYFKLFKSASVFIFFCCLGLYFIAMEINKNPQFIVNMFSSDFDEPTKKAVEEVKVKTE